MVPAAPAPFTSSVVTVTVFTPTERYSGADPAATMRLTMDVWLPSTTPSATPVTVTVWGTLQLAGVKVRETGETVASVILPDVAKTVTFAVGRVSRATVKESVVPDSLTTVLAPDSTTVMPGSPLAAQATRATGNPRPAIMRRGTIRRPKRCNIVPPWPACAGATFIGSLNTRA